MSKTRRVTLEIVTKDDSNFDEILFTIHYNLTYEHPEDLIKSKTMIVTEIGVVEDE